MFTLQDFLTLTKGQEYLLAVGSMITFAAFWMFLERKSSRKHGTHTGQNDNSTESGGTKNA